MKKAAFIAHSPYEIGDRINVLIYNGVALVNPPRLTKTTQVTITDILTIHSVKKNQVTFMYELDGEKVLPLVKWEGFNRDK